MGCGRRREAEEEKEEPGIQNQKQEPHTKMWGKRLLQDKPPKNRSNSAPKKEVISILKNARFKGSGAKS